MEPLTRYFKGERQVLIVSRHPVKGGSVATTNAHILSDPDDLTSGPVDGWVEVGEAEFAAAEAMIRFQAEALSNEMRDAQATSRKVAYDEAIQLGFSPQSASTMSGHIPA